MPKDSLTVDTNSQQASAPKARVRRGFPNFSLQQTLVVAQAIADENAGKPWSRLSLAEAIKRKPDSSAFRELLSASIQYGLTEGSHNVPQIKLTPLGMQVAMPKSDGERKQALLKAARSIPLFNELYEKFDQAKIPAGGNFRNTLIRDHNVDPSVADKCIEHFTSDGKFVGLIRTVSGSERVDILTAESAAAQAVLSKSTTRGWITTSRHRTIPMARLPRLLRLQLHRRHPQGTRSLSGTDTTFRRSNRLRAF